ncbi:MAG TPA: prolyl-tRNA synthetase associated domain-containing protein [Candidatus Lachnoclostridium stercoravium]|uniref:Prolyl-tRNA synthetase associated domain-containing protein n=1 Tax=Candidatus Lachnoclostridium stercoravium TaxID=2838633 RepID=A0A9D2HIF0_9FIRM|nr:prolyl-tRNA synthetase associated domain-containing protein [Candidatus Lachnoclostridium stercoravium]
MKPFFIDQTVYTGRPASCQGRLSKEIRVYDLLDSLQIPYSRVDHAAVDTIEACQDVDRILGIEICKNLFLCNAQKTKFYLLMMPGAKKFRTALLSKQIQSSRLSFAGPEFMEEFLDITPGSVSVLGLMNDKENRVQLLIDRDVLAADHIGCHPCINTSSLSIATKDITDRFLPAVNHSFLTVEFPQE